MLKKAGIDPRSKLFMILCISTAGIFIENAYILGLVLAASLLLSFLFGADIPSILRKAKVFLWMIAAIAVMQSFFSPSGSALLKLGDINILTSGGIIKAIEFILRTLIIISSASILVTSGTREIIQGLVQLKVPYQIAFMASVGIRFLPVLTEETKDVMTAIQLRGIEMEKISLKRKLGVYLYIFTPIVAGALIKAKKLSMSLELRAFRAYPRRTSFMVLKLSLKDYAIILASVFSTTLVMIFNL